MARDHLRSGPFDGALSDYVSAVYALVNKWEGSSLSWAAPPDMHILDESGNEIIVPKEVADLGAEAVLEWLEEEEGFDPTDEDFYVEAWYDRADIDASRYKGTQSGNVSG